MPGNSSPSIVNCSVVQSQGLPSSRIFMQNILDHDTQSESILLWFCVCNVVVLLCVCVESLEYVARTNTFWSMIVHSGWLVGLHAVMGVGSLFAMMMPRSTKDIEYICSFFIALCQYHIMNLFFDFYLGGDEEIVKRNADKCIVRGNQLQPCFRCCLCLPNCGLTTRCVRITRIVVTQSPVIHALGVLASVVLTDEKLPSVEESPPLFFEIFLACSKLTAIGGLWAVHQCFTEEQQLSYRTRKKIQALLYVLCCSIQALLLDILRSLRIIRCNPVLGLTSRAEASFINHAMITLEILFLSILSRFAVWHGTNLRPIWKIAETEMAKDTNGISSTQMLAKNQSDAMKVDRESGLRPIISPTEVWEERTFVNQRNASAFHSSGRDISQYSVSTYSSRGSLSSEFSAISTGQ